MNIWNTGSAPSSNRNVNSGFTPVALNALGDRLAIGVDEVYNHLDSYTGIALIIATIFFAIQIYCDFSGYSDIALGAAKVMGFTLMVNFNRPYASRSISEFWTRWHISLSSWFKDYLYIPLGGSWTFIIWGALHGIYLITALVTKNIGVRISDFFKKLKLSFLVNAFNIGFVFALITFAWLFFRAKTTHDAFYVVEHLLDIHSINMAKDIYLNNGQDFFVTSIFVIFFMEVVQYINSNYRNLLFKHPSVIVRWGFCISLIIMICVFGVYHNDSEFIYFQF